MASFMHQGQTWFLVEEFSHTSAAAWEVGMVCSCSLFSVTFLVKDPTLPRQRLSQGRGWLQLAAVLEHTGCSATLSTEVQFQPGLTPLPPSTGSPQHFCQFSLAGTKTHYKFQQEQKGESPYCRRSVLAKKYKSLAGHHVTWFFTGFVHKSVIRCKIFGLLPVVIK